MKFGIRTSMNAVIGIAGLFLYVTYPDLRASLSIFLLMLLGAEFFGRNIDAKNEPLLRALPMFALAAVLSFITFSAMRLVASNEPVVSTSLPFAALVTYYLVGASAEEDIFRDILPQRIGVVASNILFAVFHYGILVTTYTGLTVATLGSLNNASVVGGLIFSVIFGFAMTFLTKQFNSTAPAKAVHWMYNLFATGLIFSVGVSV